MYSFLKGTPFEYLLLRNGTPLTYLVENFASLLATASALSLKMNVSQNHALRSQRFQDFFYSHKYIELTDYSTLSYSSTSEIPTHSYSWGQEPKMGASPYN